MKFSQLFGQTLRDIPVEADVASHQLLMRAAFIRPLGDGFFSYLHLAKRSMTKIEIILRDEMNRIGGQEISMPSVHPADLWKETSSWYQIGSGMGRFKDRNDHDKVLAMTHEEVIANLARGEVQSYKQLPRLVYNIQTKWREDPRPRSGLIRAREFTMKDSYSLDADRDGLDKQYRAHYQAYFNIYRRCGLGVVTVKSDTGLMAGKQEHNYLYLTPIGEDTILLCDTCGYTATRQGARFQKSTADREKLKPIEKIHTPDCKSIESLANFLGIPKSKTAKAVFFMATIPSYPNGLKKGSGSSNQEKFIFAIIRGDMELNETKLANAIGAGDLRPASEEEIKAFDAVPGYASPVGQTVKPVHRLIVVDDIIPDTPNLVAGANEEEYHLLNVNYGRDYSADIVTDIAIAKEGHACPQCGHPMRMERGVEVGNILKLGTRNSDTPSCTFLDKDGQQKPVIMGSYGIEVGRLLACVAEEHHDEHGLVWPVTIAPYHVHLVLLRGKGTTQVEMIAGKLYVDLQAAGVEVLYDDRDESPGVKFKDADLIGCPVRITVSERALGQGGVEMKLRGEQAKDMLPLLETVPLVRSVIQSMQEEIFMNVIPVNYTD
jgi:prolyl-tRNA synthetase